VSERIPDYPRISLVAKNFVYDLVKRCGHNLTINGSAIETMINEITLLLDTHHYRLHLENYNKNKEEIRRVLDGLK
jgi:hypothetical protein